MTVPTIAPADWLGELGALHARGFTMLDLLTGIDRGAQVEVLVRVVDPDSGAAQLRRMLVDDAADSLTAVFPGAAWHERETREMFGIEFTGLTDTRPLLLREVPEIPPLRKTAWLAARTERKWPGAGGGRRTRPLGVPEESGR